MVAEKMEKVHNWGSDVDEIFKIEVHKIFSTLVTANNEQEYTFSSALTNEQRKYIHLLARRRGFLSKSYGVDKQRRVHVKKLYKTYQNLFYLKYNEHIDKLMSGAVSQYKHNNQAIKDFGGNDFKHLHANTDFSFNRLSIGHPPIVPKLGQINKLMEFRKSLPVWCKKDEIIRLLEENQVLIISSETGSGKTTQVPQFILENYNFINKPCRILCTQPRRLSTIAVAERVAAERGERVGNVVGYQVKLDMNVGITSCLAYCTNGIFLRTLMNRPEIYLKNVTHIIVDEVHERDKYTDFLLISLRRFLADFPNLRIILMSATADIELFMSYFQNAKLLNVPGKLYPVHEYYLEDILPMLSNRHDRNSMNGSIDILYGVQVWKDETKGDRNLTSPENLPYCMSDMDQAVMSCVEEGTDEAFYQVMMQIVSENCNVNHQTSQGYTVLIAAAMHGNMEMARQLLHLGADKSLKGHGGKSAMEWAHFYGKYEISEFLNAEPKFGEKSLPVYDFSTTESIDVALIVNVVAHIHKVDNAWGTILVFVPGYEDICNCIQSITNSELMNAKELELLMLHSSMTITEQHRVFEVVHNKRKIIVSTNISETSITIPDVVYVIDAGLAKEKTYDALSGTCSLQTTWISKASVKQRAGRAGRTQAGVCFHLFSRLRCWSMLNNRIPEMLRVPLHEVCLQTKILAPPNLDIASYLKNALEPPPSASVENAIKGLKELGALTKNEELTALGEHLVQLSVEPRLGKMLIYAAIFKCLDPVLTIVACLCSKDPFTLPQQPSLKRMVNEKQRQLCEDSLSDLLPYLRAYQIWQRDNNDTNIKKYLINPATMKTIHETRNQLLSQLRSASFIQVQKPFTIHDLNLNSYKWPLIKYIFAVGYYPNIAFVRNTHFATSTEKKVNFHKGSTLIMFNQEKNHHAHMHDYYVIFKELSKTGKHCTIKCGTVVTPLTVALLCGSENKTFSEGFFCIGNALTFQHDYDAMESFCHAVTNAIDKRIGNPRVLRTPAEERVLDSVLDILYLEEKRYNLLGQPKDVGLPPCTTHSKRQFGNTWHNGDNQRSLLKQQPIGTQRNGQSYLQHASTRRSDSYNGFTSNQFGDNSKYRSDGLWNYNSLVSAFENGFTISDEIANITSISPVVEEEAATTSLAQKLLNGLDFQKYQPSVMQHPVNASALNSYSNVNCFKASNRQPPSRFQTAMEKGNDDCPTVSPIVQNTKDILTLERLDLPRNAVFFIVKPRDHNNLSVGISFSTWIFSPQTEKVVFQSVKQNYFVVLFFSVSKSREFQGVAQLLDTNEKNTENLSCPIKWLNTNPVTFRRIRNKQIRNSFDSNALVCNGLDGQQVEYNTGLQLCDMFFQPSLGRDYTTFSRPILGSKR